MTSSKTNNRSLLVLNNIILYYYILITLFLPLPSITVSSFASTTPFSSSSLTSKNMSSSENNETKRPASPIGKLEELKAKEAKLHKLLQSIRKEKLDVLRSRPLRIGIIGFGRFGQFIAKTFCKYGEVVVTSRSDYTDIAVGMGVKYVPMSDMEGFLGEGLDVIVISVSITSFEPTVQQLVPHLNNYLNQSDGAVGPLIVDVLSVKEHPRNVMLDLLPSQCDILCTHPMFGPDSGKNGWRGLTFVYERTRIDGVVLNPEDHAPVHQLSEADESNEMGGESFFDIDGSIHNIHENDESHLSAMDRVERFLSIWEEEGCRMVSLSCKEHDQNAANSQFITHLMGRILSSQGLKPTPIDTQGFKSVLSLIGNTMADSFDLFYGLYKYNSNSRDVIQKLQVSMNDVVDRLSEMDSNDSETRSKM